MTRADSCIHTCTPAYKKTHTFHILPVFPHICIGNNRKIAYNSLSITSSKLLLISLYRAEIINFQPKWPCSNSLRTNVSSRQLRTTLWHRHNASMLLPHMPAMHGSKNLHHGHTNTGLISNSEQTVRLSLATVSLRPLWPAIVLLFSTSLGHAVWLLTS